jgi:aryl-alcohol dehydrogenase-like predicted oxidoreductase
VVISTKGGHPSLPDWARRITEPDIRADMEASLRHLRTDCVDVYFLHRDDDSKPVEAIMPILDALVREGKARRIGASNWTVERIDEANRFALANGLTPFSVSQIFWNGAVINKEGVYDPTLVIMDDGQHRGYAANKIPVMAYTAQAQGLFSLVRDYGVEGLREDLVRTYLNEATLNRIRRVLALAAETGLSPTAVSLAYLLHDSEVRAYPILGISSTARLQEAWEALSLSAEDVGVLFG